MGGQKERRPDKPKEKVADNMYEWLEREISSIRTPRFHVVDGPADARLRAAIEQSHLALSPSYRAFVLKFGNAKLYRRARNDSYRVGIFAGPRETTLDNGTHIYHLGFHDGASVYVKAGVTSASFAMFEFESGSEDEAAVDFEEWLTTSCARARSEFTREEWERILRSVIELIQDDEYNGECVASMRLGITFLKSKTRPNALYLCSHWVCVRKTVD